MSVTANRVRAVAFSRRPFYTEGHFHRRFFLMQASKRSIVLSLAPLLCALSAFSQSGAVSIDPTFTPSEYSAEHAATPTPSDGSSSGSERLPQPDASPKESPATSGNMPGKDSNSRASFVRF